MRSIVKNLQQLMRAIVPKIFNSWDKSKYLENLQKNCLMYAYILDHLNYEAKNKPSPQLLKDWDGCRKRLLKQRFKIELETSFKP